MGAAVIIVGTIIIRWAFHTVARMVLEGVSL